MNQGYDTLVKALDLSDSVADCAAGRITPPLAAMRSPAEWYGFPPVLIPIWSDGSGSSYLGIWNALVHRSSSLFCRDVCEFWSHDD